MFEDHILAIELQESLAGSNSGVLAYLALLAYLATTLLLWSLASALVFWLHYRCNMGVLCYGNPSW